MLTFVIICHRCIGYFFSQCCMEISVVQLFMWESTFSFYIGETFFFLCRHKNDNLNQPCGQRERRRQQHPSPHRGGVPHPPPKRTSSAPWRTLGTTLIQRKKTTTTNNLSGSKAMTAWMTGKNQTHLVPAPSIPTGKND